MKEAAGVVRHSVDRFIDFVITICFPDIVQLEQDTVLGVESLLMLCSQDNSPSAQAALKVRCSHSR